MSYKPKYVFIYNTEKELNNLLNQFPFNYPCLNGSSKFCIKYEHYELFLLKTKIINDYLEFREIIGMMVVKVLLSKSIYEYIVNKKLTIIEDIFEPMVSRCALIGNTKIEVVEDEYIENFSIDNKQHKEVKTYTMGKEISLRDLEQYNNKLVWVEFDFSGVAQCGSDLDFMTKLGDLGEQYPDGVYKVDFDNKIFVDVNDDTNSAYFYHNLVGEIYEWIEDKKDIKCHV